MGSCRAPAGDASMPGRRVLGSAGRPAGSRRRSNAMAVAGGAMAVAPAVPSTPPAMPFAAIPPTSATGGRRLFVLSCGHAGEAERDAGSAPDARRLDGPAGAGRSCEAMVSIRRRAPSSGPSIAVTANRRMGFMSPRARTIRSAEVNSAGSAVSWRVTTSARLAPVTARARRRAPPGVKDAPPCRASRGTGAPVPPSARRSGRGSIRIPGPVPGRLWRAVDGPVPPARRR